jgi:hypothetical protein
MRIASLSFGYLIVLAGCTTPALNPSSVDCLPEHIDVLELLPDMKDAPLQRVFHNGDKTVTPDILDTDRKLINERLQSAIEHAFLSLKNHRVDTHSPTVETLFGKLGMPMNTESLSALQTRYPADQYLRLRVTDFGETPQRWKASYITFEVVTTLAIAGAFYVHRVTRPIAGAYLIEESIEELSEGYVGFWALNRLSRPVRIEADLIDGHSGNIIFHLTHTGMASWKRRHVWHMDAPTTEILENESLQEAVLAIVKDMTTFYMKDCSKRRSSTALSLH